MGCKRLLKIGIIDNKVTSITNATYGKIKDVKMVTDGYELKLPSGKTVTLRLTTSEDEKNLLKINEDASGNAGDSIVTDFLKIIVSSVEGSSDKETVSKFVDSMTAFDARYLRKNYAKLVPNVKNTCTFKCNYCEFTQDMEVPLNADFFWPDL
jgi:hypothetical protein